MDELTFKQCDSCEVNIAVIVATVHDLFSLSDDVFRVPVLFFSLHRARFFHYHSNIFKQHFKGSACFVDQGVQKAPSAVSIKFSVSPVQSDICFSVRIADQIVRSTQVA